MKWWTATVTLQDGSVRRCNIAADSPAETKRVVDEREEGRKRSSRVCGTSFISSVLPVLSDNLSNRVRRRQMVLRVLNSCLYVLMGILYTHQYWSKWQCDQICQILERIP